MMRSTLMTTVHDLLKNKMVRRSGRLLLIACAAWIFFGHVCRPMILDGGSMLPNYPERGLTFCWYPSYWFSEPERGDAAIFSVGGDQVLILKRILAFPGETVECRAGQFFVNGKELVEPYVKYRSTDWNIKPFRVADGCYYVMGDNRSMPIRSHMAGETAIRRLRGKPLW